MMKYSVPVISFSFTLALLAACHGSPTDQNKKEEQGIIALDSTLAHYYFDFKMYLDDSLARNTGIEPIFKSDNKIAALPKGYSVYLNGIPVEKDKYSLAPDYSTTKKYQQLLGRQVWVIKKQDKVLLEFPVVVEAFKLKSGFPETSGSDEVSLEFEGTSDGDEAELIFENKAGHLQEPDFIYNVKNNKITIPADDFRRLQPGKYIVAIDLTKNKPIFSGGKQIGNVEITYEVSRLTEISY